MVAVPGSVTRRGHIQCTRAAVVPGSVTRRGTHPEHNAHEWRASPRSVTRRGTHSVRMHGDCTWIRYPTRDTSSTHAWRSCLDPLPDEGHIQCTCMAVVPGSVNRRGIHPALHAWWSCLTANMPLGKSGSACRNRGAMLCLRGAHTVFLRRRGASLACLVSQHGEGTAHVP